MHAHARSTILKREKKGGERGEDGRVRRSMIGFSQSKAKRYALTKRLSERPVLGSWMTPLATVLSKPIISCYSHLSSHVKKTTTTTTDKATRKQKPVGINGRKMEEHRFF